MKRFSRSQPKRASIFRSLAIGLVMMLMTLCLVLSANAVR